MTENSLTQSPNSSVQQARTPPHPMDGQWLLRVECAEYGPYTGRQLAEYAKEGRFGPSSEVRRQQGGDWILAKVDSTLCEIFPSERTRSETPPRVVETGHLNSGERATVVQVNNTIHQPPSFSPLTDMGADKSSGVALLLSFFIVGAGQIYNGDVGKGILMFFGCILLWFVFLGWIINIWSMIDAYSRAKEKRQRYHAYLAQGAARAY